MGISGRGSLASDPSSEASGGSCVSVCFPFGALVSGGEVEQNITKGQVIGEIRDYHGNLLEICRADHSGQIMYMTRTLWVDKATEVVMYAVFCDCDEHHG